ncbi:MAG: hypothetical protein RBS17_08950 [Coriobacteriia bacterium]|nr:hypothetical protein [Coriobacteriia bacterium]
MPSLTRIILRIESLVLRRSVVAWFHGGDLRSPTAAPRAVVGSLVITGWIASRFVFFAMAGLFVRAAGLSTASQAGFLLLAAFLVAMQAVAADILLVADHVFGSMRADFDYLMVPGIESSALMARLGLHLVRDACFTATTIVLLGISWVMVLGLGVGPTLAIGILGSAALLVSVSARAILICTLGRVLARPASGRPAAWLLRWRMIRTVLLGILLALISAAATGAVLYLADAMKVSGWSAAAESMSRMLLRDWPSVSSVLEIVFEPLTVAIIAIASMAVVVVAARVVRGLIRGEIRRRYRGETGTIGRVRVWPVARAIRAALAHTRWASSAIPILQKDIALCLREPARFLRAVFVATSVHGVIVGIGWVVLQSSPVDLVPFNFVIIAGCISAAAMAQSLLPVFAVGAEGRNIDLIRGALVSPAHIISAKLLGMGLVVGGVSGALAVVAEIALGAGWAEVVLATLGSVVAAALIALPPVIATAVFPLFEWRQPIEVTRSIGANLLAQILQQPVYMAVLVVPTVPVVEQVLVGSAAKGIAWLQLFGILGVVGVIVVGAGLAFGTERLTSHLDHV